MEGCIRPSVTRQLDRELVKKAMEEPKPSVQVEATLPGLTLEDDSPELRKAVAKAYAKTMGVDGDNAIVTPKTGGRRMRQLDAGDLSYDVLIAMADKEAAKEVASKAADVKPADLKSNLQKQMAADPKLAAKKDKVKEIPAPKVTAIEEPEDVKKLLQKKETIFEKEEEDAVRGACAVSPPCHQPPMPLLVVVGWSLKSEDT